MLVSMFVTVTHSVRGFVCRTWGVLAVTSFTSRILVLVLVLVLVIVFLFLFLFGVELFWGWTYQRTVCASSLEFRLSFA
jgi:hypothetical protein